MKVTVKAIEQFKNAIEQYNTPGSDIWLFASNGYCGPLVQMSVLNHASVRDKVVTINDIEFFIESTG